MKISDQALCCIAMKLGFVFSGMISSLIFEISSSVTIAKRADI